MTTEDRPERSEPERAIPEAEIDETLDESFPASDPPQRTLGIDPHDRRASDDELLGPDDERR